MNILSRYILREHAAPFVAALGVLTALMLLNQLARRFGDLLGKGLPWQVIVEVFALSIPFIVAMTLPMAVLVATLYAFSRLGEDNEVTAIKAGGISLSRLIVPVLLAATALAAGMIWFNDNVLPESNHALRALLSDIGRKRPTFELRERVVNEVVPGKLFLQPARIDRARSVLGDLVIFDLRRTDAHRTIYADSGHMAFNPEGTDLYLTLYDGSMLELETDDPATEGRTHYRTQVIRVSGVTNQLERRENATFRGDREMTIAMMRDEIRDQRERMNELADTLKVVLFGVRPLDDAPRADEPLSTPVRATDDADADDGSESPDPTAEPEGGELRDPRDIIRGRTADRARRLDLAGRAASSGRDTGADGRRRDGRFDEAAQLRAMIQKANRGGWPPADPVVYASRIRGQFQRIANRMGIHRREVNRFRVEIQKKFAIPVAAIVFVLIGAPIGARFPRGGIGMVIGVSLGVFCFYYVCLIGGEELADRGFITPFWGMWAPNVLFAIAGLITLYLVSRSGVRHDRGLLERGRRRASRLWAALAGRPAADGRVGG